jgi:hypothetical protein
MIPKASAVIPSIIWDITVNDASVDSPLISPRPLVNTGTMTRKIRIV